MYFVKPYPFLICIFLLYISEPTFSQLNKSITPNSNNFGYIKDSGIQYKVLAYFVDKTLKAKSSIQLYGSSLESIMANLNKQRNGLGIIIEKVWIVKKNRKGELLNNIPPEFMRETDSLLKKYRVEQNRKSK